MLKEATEAGVSNVARYYHHETIRVSGRVDEVIHNVRKALNDTVGRNPLQQRAVYSQRSASSESLTSPTATSVSGAGKGRSRNRSRTMTRKRSSSSIQASIPPSKRSCSDSPIKQGSQKRRNRVHRRLVMQDVGKSIYEASSPRNMLTGLLGGIRGECHMKHLQQWLI